MQGTWFLIVGTVLMLADTYMLFEYPQQNFLLRLLITLFQPASWFLFWEGLDQIIFESKKNNVNMEFYKKMSESVIEFFNK